MTLRDLITYINEFNSVSKEMNSVIIYNSTEYPIRATTYSNIPDFNIGVHYGDNKIGLGFFIKKNQTDDSTILALFDRLEKLKPGLRFYFLISDNYILYHDNMTLRSGYQKILRSTKEFVKVFQKSPNPSIKKKHLEEIVFVLNQEADKLSERHPGLFKYIQQLRPDQFTYSILSNEYSFKRKSNILNKLENKIYQYILEDVEVGKKIYRYTSLSALFKSLQTNTFRMNGLMGMNDISEVNYSQNYITKRPEKELLDQKSKVPYQTMESINRRFISSCTILKDDLTQWRLYGDDCKGVMLTFKCSNTEAESNVVLKKVSYANEDGTHPELDFFVSIITRLLKERINFKFLHLNYWHNFFKPFEYNIEKEVRLLVIVDSNYEDKKWCLTNTHNILNPYIEFKLNSSEIPIKLTAITFGPKLPEKFANKLQLQQLIRECKNNNDYLLDKLYVDTSNITNYR